MTPRNPSPLDGPIDTYLDTLLEASRCLPPRIRRSLLSETEAHLLDSAEDAEARGLTRQQAEARAVSNFGAAGDIVAAHRRTSFSAPLIARQVAVTGLFLGGIGAVAVGISGLVAEAIRWFDGSRALVDVPARGTLAASDCVRWLRIDPHALNCQTAAQADWANETVAYRVILGLIGALLLLVLHLYVRRRGGGTGLMLAPVVRDTVAAALFGAAGVATLVLGVEAIVVASGFGAGQWLSAAPVALLLAGYYAFRVTRNLPT